MCKVVYVSGTIAAKKAASVDVAAPRKEFLFSLPRWASEIILSNLRDARDMPVATLYFNIILTAFPAVSLLYTAPASHTFGALYLVSLYALFLARFLVALLHVTEHRPLFRQGNNVFHYVTVMLLAPLFGVPSGMYPLHHRVMHHVEGNGQGRDLSSTEQYQRDSVLHFLWYWVRHASAAWLELPFYALRKRRLGLLARSAAAESVYFIAVCLLWRWKPVQTLWAFILPYVITSAALMFGNWSQHMFVNPKAPGSAYGMTYNCIACGDNAITFNDGYHIQHHLNSRTHWSELPLRFMEGLEEHAAQAGLAFKGLSVFEVGLAVFMGRMDLLVSHLLICGGEMAQMSKCELKEMLRERLKPVLTTI